MQLPPTNRDFLAYERIVIHQASTRQVAQELAISQTRVRQIVARAAEWLAQNLPTDDEASDAAHLRLAQHIAAERLDHYLTEVNRSWRQTGETRYLGILLRLILAQAKLPIIPGTLGALAADAIEGPLPDDVEETPPRADLRTSHPTPTTSSPTKADEDLPTIEQPSTPPVRNCSITPAAPPAHSPIGTGSCFATQVPQSSYQPGRDPLSSVTTPIAAPAQTSPVITTSPHPDHLRPAPRKLAFATAPAPNRHERRRLKRLAAKN